MKRKQGVRALLLVFIAGVFLSGCQSAINPRQRLKLNLACEPPTLDPRLASDSTSMTVLNALFEGITRFHGDEPALALARSIAISSDQRVYTIHLLPSQWTNGDSLNAQDFVQTWQSILDPLFPAPYAYKFFVIENAEEIKNGTLPVSKLGVKALDSATLEIRLKHPVPYFLELLAFPTFFPLHPSVLSNPDWACAASNAYISNGPFTLKKWDHDDELILVKNPTYWDQKQVILEEIHFAMVEDTMTEMMMYDMNELDWAGSPLSNLPFESIPELKESKKLQSYPVSAIYFYKINTTRFPLNNVHIRKALAYAICRKEIVSHLLQAGQIPAMGLIPETCRNCRRVSYFDDHHRARARKEFEAGLFETGLTLDTFPLLTLSFNTNREHQKIAESIQDQWREVLGIHVSLATNEWKTHLHKLSHLDFDIARSAWIADFNDPLTFLLPYRAATEENNETGWSHPLFANLLKQAEQEVDLIKRGAILQEAEKFLIDEMPLIPLYYLVYSFQKKHYVQGIMLSSLGHMDFKYAFIDRGRL